MKNRPLYILVAAVAIIVTLLIIWLYMSAVGGALPENSVSGLCTILFLTAAIIGYELLAKPGLYSRRTEKDDEGEEKKDGGKGEDST